jgi:hypothetical protein
MWRVSQVTIASPGLHSINLWMREDGAYVDRLLLTTNLAFTPTGAGPPESARIAGMTNLPPSVAITDPANGAMFLAGAPVIVSAGASDADGVVTRVEFFANGSSIGTDTNAPYEASFSPVPGDYVLTAAAADDDAKTTIAAAVAMNIGPAPTVFPALTVFIENGRLRLTYEIPPELRFFDIVVVKSSNLLSWTPGENLFEEITRTQSGNGWQRVTLLTPVSQLTAGPMYFRLAKRDGP